MIKIRNFFTQKSTKHEKLKFRIIYEADTHPSIIEYRKASRYMENIVSFAERIICFARSNNVNSYSERAVISIQHVPSSEWTLSQLST